MSKVEDFLTKAEEAEVVEAIRIAEKNTSGEIRVHLEKKTSIAPLERAVEVFHKLKMTETKDRNGVIFYVAVKSKQFAIYGDENINKKVGADFWNSTRDIMTAHFKLGNNKQALVDGIIKAGEQLKQFFPHESDDKNELSDDISNEISIG
jgi:uncharacterized membrane protein